MFFWKKKPERKRVRVYDFDSRTFSTIPADELAPGMVLAQIQREDGTEEEAWVESGQLQINTYQHPPFDEEVRDYFRTLKAALDEVYPQTIEEWEDLFRRDVNWEREVAIWLHIADVYQRLTRERDLSHAEKLEIFRVLVACTMAPREEVPTVVGLQALTKEEAEGVIRTFYNE